MWRRGRAPAKVHHRALPGQGGRRPLLLDDARANAGAHAEPDDSAQSSAIAGPDAPALAEQNALGPTPASTPAPTPGPTPMPTPSLTRPCRPTCAPALSLHPTGCGLPRLVVRLVAHRALGRGEAVQCAVCNAQRCGLPYQGRSLERPVGAEVVVLVRRPRIFLADAVRLQDHVYLWLIGRLRCLLRICSRHPHPPCGRGQEGLFR